MVTNISNLGCDLTAQQKQAVEQTGREIVAHYRYYFDERGVCVGHKSRHAYSSRTREVTPDMRRETADDVDDAMQEMQEE